MYPSSLHSLAHRAPATRTRVRWQPYGSLPTPAQSSASISSARSPSSTCFNSPSSSAPSSPITAPQCDADLPKQTQATPQPQQQPSRDAQPRDKNKFALGLVEQAVKSLCEIWRPQDIPQVFLTTSRVPGPGSELCNNKYTPSVTPQPSLFATGIHTDCDAPVGTSNLVPMKSFVHEVLRRSRTSGSVLQTALCYLEAIRPRISELAQSDEAFKPETELADRITVATEAELAREAEFCIGTDTILINESDDSMDTVRVSDTTSYSGSTAVSSGLIEDGDTTLKKDHKGPSPTLTPLPTLPSPLLCPRRAFLASLILASKFTQDKCYSNRAWAKLSGLPPREIGRCERALGDALDWRLWVGKSSPSQSQGTGAPSSTVQPTRSLSRCRSENSIPSGPADISGGFLSCASSDKRSAPISPPSSCRTSPEVGRTAGLRRAATLPAEAFAFSADGDKRLRGSSHWARNSIYKPSSVDESVDMAMSSPVQERGTESVFSACSAEIHISDTSPPTPGLSYSPTSTESSSGDRTVQMPCFFDDKSMASIDTLSSSVSLSGIPLEAWPWLEHSPTGQIAVTSLGRIVGAMQESHLPSVTPFAHIASTDAILEISKKHMSDTLTPMPISMPRTVLTYQ